MQRVKKLKSPVVPSCALMVLSVTSLSVHSQPQKSAIVADEVVVTATRFPDRYVDTPVNVTVITSEDIKNSTAKTLPDLLSEQAGISVHDLFGNNAATTTIDMRGFGPQCAHSGIAARDFLERIDIEETGGVAPGDLFNLIHGKGLDAVPQ